MVALDVDLLLDRSLVEDDGLVLDRGGLLEEHAHVYESLGNQEGLFVYTVIIANDVSVLVFDDCSYS